MKRSSNWDEKIIESQLRKLPKIEDKQSKEALFERIQEKLQEEQIKERKKKNWFIPTIAAAAVLFLMLLIVPSFLNEQDLTTEHTDFPTEESLQGDVQREVAVEDNTEDQHGIATTEMAPETKSVENTQIYLSAVQPVEAEQYKDELVTLAVPVYGPTSEFVIPITLLASGSNDVERFMVVKDLFNGEDWGIGSFPSFPINSAFTEKEGTLVIDVPTGTFESLSSAEDSVYKQALVETFSPRFREIEFRSDGKAGVVWGQAGPINEINLEAPNKGYYLFESATGHLFLLRGKVVNAPSGGDLFETLQTMKNKDVSGNYLSAIPENLEIINVEHKEGTAIVTFKEGTLLENNPLHLAMVEAILFTARDFGYSFVEFRGVESVMVGPYSLPAVIEIPEHINFIR